MKKHVSLLLFAAIISIAGVTRNCGGIEVVYAQSLPTTVHAVWTPSLVDSTHPAPLQYQIVNDNDPPIIVLLSNCTPTQCTAAVPINSYGNHNTVISAQYLAISTDPNSLTSVPAPAVQWVLNNGSNPVTNHKVVK